MIDEINSLISIRSYVYSAVNNFQISKEQVRYMSQMLVLIDKKIISLLSSDKFKEYVGFENLKVAMDEVIKLNNIKSSLK